MGFGHRVYRAEDPRARVLRRTAREIGAPRLEVAEKLEEAALAELKARKPDRVLATNVEFWSAVVLDFADVPPDLFTPMFASARVGGWAAHIMEQKREGRLIRPSAQVRRARAARGRRGERRRPRPDGPAASTKRLVLVAAILGTTVVTVDSTVVNVALPAIDDDLGGGLAGQQWTSNAYLVTLSSLLLVAGSLGDLFGARRVFASGWPASGSPRCSARLRRRSSCWWWPARSRACPARCSPRALAVIVANFPPDERGRAVGAWTAWGGIGTVLGPLIGGQLVDTASWRWIFAINVPIVLITLFLVLRVVPEGESARPTQRST